MVTSVVRVYVCPVPAHQEAVKTIKQAVVAAGAQLVGEADAGYANSKAHVAACDVVVILVCAETIHSPEIAEVVGEAKRLGKRIIGVWLDEDQPEPDWLAREGDGSVPLVTDELVAVIKGERVFEDSKGRPMPEKPTPRHKGH